VNLLNFIKTLNNTIRKSKYICDQGNGKESLHKYWNYKKKKKSDQRKT
jgi:hypothetical protein